MIKYLVKAWGEEGKVDAEADKPIDQIPSHAQRVDDTTETEVWRVLSRRF